MVFCRQNISRLAAAAVPLTLTGSTICSQHHETIGEIQHHSDEHSCLTSSMKNQASREVSRARQSPQNGGRQSPQNGGRQSPQAIGATGGSQPPSPRLGRRQRIRHSSLNNVAAVPRTPEELLCGYFKFEHFPSATRDDLLALADESPKVLQAMSTQSLLGKILQRHQYEKLAQVVSLFEPLTKSCKLHPDFAAEKLIDHFSKKRLTKGNVILPTLILDFVWDAQPEEEKKRALETVSAFACREGANSAWAILSQALCRINTRSSLNKVAAVPRTPEELLCGYVKPGQHVDSATRDEVLAVARESPKVLHSVQMQFLLGALIQLQEYEKLCDVLSMFEPLTKSCKLHPDFGAEKLINHFSKIGLTPNNIFQAVSILDFVWDAQTEEEKKRAIYLVSGFAYCEDTNPGWNILSEAVYKMNGRKSKNS